MNSIVWITMMQQLRPLHLQLAREGAKKTPLLKGEDNLLSLFVIHQCHFGDSKHGLEIPQTWVYSKSFYWFEEQLIA